MKILIQFLSLWAQSSTWVAWGSFPLACSLFSISYEIVMQVVAIGMIIGVAEMALNLSADVLFTATVCLTEDQTFNI